MRQWLSLALLIGVFGCHGAFAQQADSEQPDTEIKVVNAPQDQAIAARLGEITAAINGLEQVDISVSAGVVTLQGEIASAQLRNELTTIASRLEGVVHVQNQLQEPLAVRSRLAPAAEKFREMLATTVQMLPLLLLAVLAVVLFSLLGSWLSRRNALLRRIGLSELATNLGMRFVRLIVTSIGILIALELLDATALVSAMLGVAGVIGIALGFAFRNIVENYLAGVLLSTRNPFAIGDFIQVDEMTGKVIRLTSRDTVLMTLDGNHLRIPNSQIITSPMTNFTRNPLRRFEFNVGVSVELDLVRVRELAISTLSNMPGILTEPRPRVLVLELGDSAVTVRVMAWIDQRQTDFLKARSEAIRLVKTAFDQAGIEMPEPIYRLHMVDMAAQNSSYTPDNSTDAPEATSAAAAISAPEVAVVDVSADTAIEQQLNDELKQSAEENLLPAADKKAVGKPAS
ncbi:MAG: mechanosensitive ion channel protein MscS [Rheinheimera sp.]|uniref:mechanosensitive ion channel family protein n=1 Tax=Arsukibacterium sp. UBA3155 TaxID=1946058 RepID=UPI000C938427|nr:mechanosensitive ion channel family protein [Arsukibacterium sp. UBA3155]MAD76408.1 mechanosensitive ion channel protein MscS [Rheinheimera sp.]|tara:strand:+ start:47269 stop:48639 length:1371 start_codon:yes stop_codon:yes gene_type:complete